MSVPIAYIDVRFFAHATEDAEKVVEAAKHVFPAEFADDIVFKRKRLEGHYGNPIVTFEARIKDKKLVKAFAERLAAALNPLDKETLQDLIERSFSHGNVYIRLDKQAAFAGELKLCTTDPIHLQVHFSRNTLDGVKEACRQMGLIP